MRQDVGEVRAHGDLLAAVLDDEVGVVYPGELGRHAHELVMVELDLLDELAVEVDELAVARDGSRARVSSPANICGRSR